MGFIMGLSVIVLAINEIDDEVNWCWVPVASPETMPMARHASFAASNESTDPPLIANEEDTMELSAQEARTT